MAKRATQLHPARIGVTSLLVLLNFPDTHLLFWMYLFVEGHEAAARAVVELRYSEQTFFHDLAA